jgi:hypothetical protein
VYALLAKESTGPVLEHLSKIKEILDCLIFLPFGVGQKLLRSFGVLCEQRNDLQDYLILVLRKASLPSPPFLF